jgi:hypothetical protein
MKKIPGFLEERQGMIISKNLDIDEVAKKIFEYFTTESALDSSTQVLIPR